MVLKIFYDLMSQPSRAVVLFARLNKIPYQDCPIALRKGEHLWPDFAAINPFKKVPAIDHNGFCLSESVAILRYLSREFPVADHWYPKASEGQAKVDEYLEWQHLNTRMPASMYFQHKVIRPNLFNKPVDEVALSLYSKLLNESLDQFENVWLPNKRYLAGKEISLADIVALVELDQPINAGYDVAVNRPRLQEWFDRVRNDLQPHYSDVNKFLHKVKEKQLTANL